jgi:DNA-binding response OmpR family regulator
MPTTVLIVDDDTMFVETLTFALNLAGFVTHPAYDGPQALDILNSEAIDVVVLDVMLPDMDGFEVCRQIRNNPRFGQVPVLMLSARTRIADKLSGFESGADDYVSKPAHPREVLARIRALVGRVQRARGITAAAIAFVGAKGGVGNTTVALNTALALANPSRRVILVELGSLALTATWQLSLNPSHDFASLVVPAGIRLATAILQPCILLHESGLHYLPISTWPSHPRLSTGFLVETLSLLQTNYDTVILDVGASALNIYHEILPFATHIIPVTEDSHACAHHFLELLQWLKQAKLDGKLAGFVLINRTSAEDSESPAALATRAGLGLLAVLPAADAALSDGDSRQQPLYLAAPDCPTALAIAALAKNITANPIRVQITP